MTLSIPHDKMYELNAGLSEWQTRQTQNLLWVTTCGFKSRGRHDSEG